MLSNMLSSSHRILHLPTDSPICTYKAARRLLARS